MGKFAGHIKRATYGLRNLTSKALKTGGTVAAGLGVASTALAGLHPLLHPALYGATGLVGKSILKGLVGMIPVVGNVATTIADVGTDLAKQELEADAGDKEFGGLAWGTAGVGLRKLGEFIEPPDTILTFKNLLFDKYQIDKVDNYDRLWLSCKSQPQTCMISYLSGPIWKCSLSTSFTKKDTKITIPNKDNMLFKFNFDLMGCKVGKLRVICQKKDDGKIFEIVFDKYQPKYAAIISGMAIEVKF